MSISDDRSLLGLWHQQHQFDANMQMRRTQVQYQAVLLRYSDLSRSDTILRMR
jgi:hypothetical protein